MASSKNRKYPKQPKTSAPLSTWERYKMKCKEVDQHNAKVAADAKKKQTIIAGIRKGR
jgi:hypothetical protein